MNAKRALVLLFTAAGLLGTALAAPAAAYTIKTTGSGKRIRWGTDTVVVRMDTALQGFLGPGEALSATLMSMDAWKGLPGVPDVLLSKGEPAPRGYHPGRSTNGLYLVDPWIYDARKLAVTVTTYEEATGRLLDADVLVNAEAAYALLREDIQDPARAYDLAAVMAHEFGHVLGLGESEEDPMATMWPYISMGDTHQRVIAEDDEAGAIAIYEGTPPAPLGGCGGASVMGRTRGGAGMAWVVLGALTLLWLCRGRWPNPVRARSTTWMGAFGFIFLFSGVPTGGVADDGREAAALARLRGLDAGDLEAALAIVTQASDDPAASVRLAAAEVLQRLGAREERELAAKLAADTDPDVAIAGRRTLRRLAAAPPRERIEAGHPAAQERLADLLEGSRSDDGRPQLLRGRIAPVEAIEEDGLFWTTYDLVDAAGQPHRVRLPGGTVNGITQQVGEEFLPDADTEVVVAPHPRADRWAYVKGGDIYGGALGDGPAIHHAL